MPIPPTALMAILLAALFVAGPVPVSAQVETQVAAVARPSSERVKLPQAKPSKPAKPSRIAKTSGKAKASKSAKAPKTLRSAHMDPGRPCGGADVAPYRQSGRAHYYGVRHHGQRTANGEEFDMGALTAAHLTLPFGTRVRVTNVSNGRSVVVRINDRHARRTPKIIDLSRGAADSLGFRRKGVTMVRLAAVCGG
ncbi:septal ring lytic transglycosylase RlpA family protein [Allostella humosa]|uniref:septal ring lytic transglycosylase RlpA family protein n=1 Tax=Stella humosa TaxID=94 RepID=UPI001FEBE0B9|nr:septal ring lytic transglycosylase RlpA family protein [Stella humosa]